jgi:hypothetical protein
MVQPHFLGIVLLFVNLTVQAAQSVPATNNSNPDDSYTVSTLGSEQELQTLVQQMPTLFRSPVDEFKKVHLWAATMAYKNVWPKKIMIVYSQGYQMVWGNGKPPYLATRWGLLLNVKIKKGVTDAEGKSKTEESVRTIVIPGGMGDSYLTSFSTLEQFIQDSHVFKGCKLMKDYRRLTELNNNMEVDCYYMTFPPYYYSIDDIKNRDVNYQYLLRWRMKDYHDAKSYLLRGDRL